ncbi:MAG: hypothetical protein OEV08_01500 [Nitrospira sp.]|nr:hypothetical protein [Nitrospira sp.]
MQKTPFLRSIRTANAGSSIFQWLASFFILLAWLSSADNLSAQTASISNSPAELVKRYLTLDYKGARLDALSVEAVASYTDWSEEPTWGQVIIVKSFVVAENHRQWDVVDQLEVVIPVTFHTLGSVYLEAASFHQDVKTEEVRFRLKAVNNRWKIIEPMIPPHVGQKRMMNVVREAWVKETDQTKRERLESLRDELRKAP